MIQAKILSQTADEKGCIIVQVEGKTRKLCTKCMTLVFRGSNLLGHITDYCNCKREPIIENVKLDNKFKQKMEKYKSGIIEDLKNKRDISAIICGYGFTFKDEYLKAYKWIKENISEIDKL